MQKSRKHIILIEPVPGGKGEGVDPAKLAVRRVVDELFDCTHRFRLCRLPQSTEEILGFAGKFHGTIGLTTATQVPCGEENGKQATDPQKKLGPVPTFDTIVSSTPPIL